ncbi:MAG: c-type cytochrome biogenesis protein CcmI/CycH [Sulfuricaulis sp.]
MTISRFPRAARYLGMIAVIAGIGISGCQRAPEATAAAPMTNAPAMHAPEATAIKDSAAAAATALRVTVSLSPALAGKAAPDDVVFIFARPATGPRMPLAIVRKQVRDLPVTVALDDSQGMSPQMKLSTAPEVVVVARVTKSGMADARDGDLEGVSAPVASGTRAISISIDKVLSGQKAPGMPQGHPGHP